MSFRSINWLYGIDILNDNITSARERLFNKFCEEYSNLYKEKCDLNLIYSVKHIIERNLIQGNTLTLKKVNSDEPIIFSQWSIIQDKIKRREYSFANLISYSPFEKDNNKF